MNLAVAGTTGYFFANLGTIARMVALLGIVAFLLLCAKPLVHFWGTPAWGLGALSATSLAITVCLLLRRRWRTGLVAAVATMVFNIGTIAFNGPESEFGRAEARREAALSQVVHSHAMFTAARVAPADMVRAMRRYELADPERGADALERYWAYGRYKRAAVRHGEWAAFLKNCVLDGEDCGSAEAIEADYGIALRAGFLDLMAHLGVGACEDAPECFFTAQTLGVAGAMTQRH